MMYCRNCGSQIPCEAFVCVHCGVKVAPIDPIERALFPHEGRSWLVTLLLCWFVGIFGVHRFYTGHTLIGVLQLVTLGGCGIWWIFDLIMIMVGSYRDFEDRPLVK